MTFIVVEFYIMQIVRTLFVYVIPKCLFFLHKIIPRTTSRMTTITDDTAPAMVEVSEVYDIGVSASGLVDVVILVI